MILLHPEATPGVGVGGVEALAVQLCQPSLCPATDLLAEALAFYSLSRVSIESATGS